MITFANHPNYIAKHEIGKGEFGSVFEVIDTDNNNHIYAIKKMEIKNDDKIKEMENEVELLSSLNSEYIVKYFDSFYDNDYFYIVMEYCGDSNLEKLIGEYKKKNDLIDENIIFSIINDICLGIKEIHNNNIIHRDLKPSNIFLGKDFKIKIGDFGISKKLNHQIYANSCVGSYMYMAPEISLNKTKYNNKVDIWSLGCIVYELLTLNNYYNVLVKELIEEAPQEIALEEKYNKCWVELLKSLLKKKYDERPKIEEVCDLVKECGNKIKSISASTSSTSLINDISSRRYYIKFKGDIKEDEIFLSFFDTISIKEMFEILLKKHYSINTIDEDKYFFIYNSRIINNPHFLNKTLYQVFHHNQNILIKIIRCGEMLG